jgi:hypothetical protein
MLKHRLSYNLCYCIHHDSCRLKFKTNFVSLKVNFYVERNSQAFLVNNIQIEEVYKVFLFQTPETMFLTAAMLS